MEGDTTKNCSCYRCKAACQHVPGWFLPGEAEKAAELKGMSLRKFFKKYLGVTWGREQHETENTFVLAPAIKSAKPGREYPGDPRGVCVFFNKDGLCDIHEAAPYECRQYLHDDSHMECVARHSEVKNAWKDHQDQIKELLGREHPRAEKFIDKDGYEWK